MAQADMYNMEGKVVGKVDLADAVFAAEVNETAVHAAVVQYLANQRQGTQSALTRREVRGGGIKPRPQKGGGRSRQGSIRSPQWKGGGVVFAPKPRDYSFKLNKKVKRLALKSALTSKFNDGGVVVLDELKLPEVKTKGFVKALNALKLTEALFVLDSNDQNVVLSARNVEGVKTAQVNELNVYDVLKYDRFVVTKAAAERIGEVYA